VSLQVIGNTPQERAQQRGATARRLIGELTPFKPQLVVSFGLIVLSALAQAGGPYLIGRAIDQYIVPGDRAGLAQTMLVLLVVYVVGALATRGQIFQVGSTGQRVLANIRARLFDQFQHVPLGYFDRRPVGDLISRVTNDVDTLNNLLTQGLPQLLGSLFSLIGIIIAMLVLNGQLALIAFTVIPAILLVTTYFGRRSRRAFRKARETTGDVTATLQEDIVGVREAQAFNRTETNIRQFERSNAANRDANIQAVSITSAFAPSLDLLNTLSTALVIGAGGYFVFRGSLTVGTLASFLIYIQQFFRPIELAAQVYTQVQASLAGGERIYAILDEAREPVDVQNAAPIPPIKGQIEFEHVDFAYEANRLVLQDVQFSLPPGQTVALVGSTGAGKTTIASLIPRFYDVVAGAVKIDGVDVRSVTRRSLREQIAMVLQEPFLFSGTIADNIGYGKQDATRVEIEAAARAVDAHDFIAALPDGYDTSLNEGGGSISQGQRQLLSFARAVLADPRILILDEATSNIDTRTEAIIQNALRTLLAGRTSVVIAHRLSTIRTADLILVIEGGRIVERGTHDELVAQNGRYAELNRRQFREPAHTTTAPSSNGALVEA